MKYPIGIQTFEKIIKGGYVYVDKTNLVYKLVSTGEYYFISRPRRFGKSLLTTTLEAYFQGKKELFKGLAIEQLEKDWLEYPVFHIDFSGASYTDPKVVENRLEMYFSKWEEMYGKNSIEVGYENRFIGLLQRAVEKKGNKCVILVDEYDKPLTDNIGNEEVQDKIRQTLQGFYGVLKNADKYIKFAFLTGVTEYGKLGIFSAANNPETISSADDYASICGITEEQLRSYFDNEVLAFAEKLGVDKERMYEMLKNRFNGYRFSIYGESVYNPYSLLSALKSKSLENRWSATGTPSYLVNILKKRSFDLSKFTEGIYATEQNIKSFGNGEENITAALYQSGYLTIKGYEDGAYMLGFPNEEVAESFVHYLIADFSGKNTDALDPELFKLRKLLRANDTDAFMSQIQFIISQIPFESKDVKLIEANFRNMIYLVIRSTGHKVYVEHPVLGGRIDIFFETEKSVYIIECKRDGSAQEALSQIDEKKYAKKITSADKQVVKIGVNFSTEERNIAEWKVEG